MSLLQRFCPNPSGALYTQSSGAAAVKAMCEYYAGHQAQCEVLVSCREEDYCNLYTGEVMLALPNLFTFKTIGSSSNELTLCFNYKTCK